MKSLHFDDKLLGLLAAVGIVLSVVVLLGFLIYYPRTPKTSPIKVDVFQYNQHEYLLFESQYNTEVLHSPDCKKCFDLFD